MTDINRNEHERAGAYFDRKGDLFDSLYSPDHVSPVMRFLNRHFRSDIYERYRLTMEHLKATGAASLLDIGIGSARYAEGYLNAGVNRIVGVDISSTMLEIARKHVQGLPDADAKIEFVLSDINEFESQEKFDVVVAMGFFDYTPDPVKCLSRMRSFSSHSVIASFPSISVYRTPIRKIRYQVKNCPVYFYRRGEIERISVESGFSKCQISKIRGAGMDYVAVFFK